MTAGRKARRPAWQPVTSASLWLAASLALSLRRDSLRHIPLLLSSPPPPVAPSVIAVRHLPWPSLLMALPFLVLPKVLSDLLPFSSFSSPLPPSPTPPSSSPSSLFLLVVSPLPFSLSLSSQTRLTLQRNPPVISPQYRGGLQMTLPDTFKHTSMSPPLNDRLLLIMSNLRVTLV